MDTEIKQLIEAINRPVIPVELDIWDAKHVGAYLKVSARQVTERYAVKPDFPAAIRLPSEKNGRGHPRWKAQEIINWAFGYQEKSG